MTSLKNLIPVDVYIPKGFNIFGYDVNSLYPYIMKFMQMPVGIPKYFKVEKGFDFISHYVKMHGEKPFGFFKVRVFAPSNLHIPIIQTRLKRPAGTRTMSVHGEWTDVIFSEEIYNAEKYGYKF